MQFLLHTVGQVPDLAAIEDAIADLDPAVLLDTGVSAGVLRISTVLTEDELLASLRQAGVDAAPGDLERQPSECCGGCGG
jgi:hypothetical protein